MMTSMIKYQCRNAYYHLDDKSYSFEETIQKSKDYLDHSSRSTCQIVVISWIGDQMSSFDVVDCFDSFVKIHVIGIYDRIIKEGAIASFERLSLHHSGSFHMMSTSTDDIKTLHACVDEIFETHYREYKGFITVGHLTTPFQLFPNPYLSIWSAYGSMNELPIVFPTLLPIIGFCHMRTLSSVPSVFQFFIYPSPNQGEQNPLLALLNESLKRLKKAAVVQLEDDWFGVLTTHIDYKLVKNNENEQGEISERSVLVLSVLKKNMDLGWIDSIKNYIEKGEPETIIDSSSFASYDPIGSDGYIIPSVSIEQLELDFARLTDFLKQLPDKRVSLFNLCERMRNKASTFGMPGIMNGIVHILQKEMAKDDKEKNFIIKELLYYINNKVNPIEWNEVREIDNDVSQSTKITISNLLD